MATMPLRQFCENRLKAVLIPAKKSDARKEHEIVKQTLTKEAFFNSANLII